jgi:hypothetical protein
VGETFPLFYIKKELNMYTVFIKTADLNMLIDVDKIERIMYGDNEIFAFNLYEERCPIYRGKAVNGDKAIVEVVSLIHSAKMHSENTKQAIIIDFSKDLDDPKITIPMPKDVQCFTRVF